jgi:hypothetical protein
VSGFDGVTFDYANMPTWPGEDPRAQPERPAIPERCRRRRRHAPAVEWPEPLIPRGTIERLSRAQVQGPAPQQPAQPSVRQPRTLSDQDVSDIVRRESYDGPRKPAG